MYGTGVHELGSWSYHISRIYYLFCTESIRSMRRMHVLAQGVGYTYDMDLFVDRGVNVNCHWYACFEVKSSEILCTQVYPKTNRITGSYKAVKIYDQIIEWSNNANEHVPFSTKNLKVSCQCAFFSKATLGQSNCCKHIIGHLRRIKYISI